MLSPSRAGWLQEHQDSAGKEDVGVWAGLVWEEQLEWRCSAGIRDGKDGEGRLGLYCSLHRIWGHFFEKQPSRKQEGIVQFKRCEKPV